MSYPKVSNRVELFNDEAMFNLIQKAPVTFVTGKGGVGKTTMASLLSKASALHGERTLFVSLHNDLSTQKLLGVSKDSNPGQIYETSIENTEFVHITPASALTNYLDDNKLGSFISMLTNNGLLQAISSLVPGMRELLIISSIRKLNQSNTWDHIIVDTPSTGHAQSLFDIAQLAESTTKSGAIKKQAESAKDFMSDNTAVQILVITLDHVMPLSECREFVFTLEDSLNASIAGIVVNRSNVGQTKKSQNIDSELKGIFLPIYSYPPIHKIKQTKKKFKFFTRQETLPSFLRKGIELDKETNTVVFLGTGGVGKTTGSAAFAIARANKKQKVALLTIDPARRLGTALGLQNSKTRSSFLDPKSLEQYREPTKDSLDVFQLDSRAEFMDMLKNNLSKKDYKKSNKNAFVLGISRAGVINDFMAIEMLHRLVTSKKYDLVVVDTPPSHHVFDLLLAPNNLQKVFRSPIFKTFLNAGTVAGLGANITFSTFFRPLKTILGKVLISDTLSFLKTIKNVEEIFSNHVDEVSQILKSSNTQYIGISRPEEISREQITDVAKQIQEKEFNFSHVILNGFSSQEYDVQGEIEPFASELSKMSISTGVLPTYEYNNPIDIVKAMSKDIS